MNDRAIDMHVHLWGHNSRGDAATLLAMLDRYDIEWLGVIPLWGGHYPTPEQIEAGNRFSADFCAARPDRCKLILTVNPLHGRQAVDLVLRARRDYGASAIKIWVASRADEPETFAVAQACVEAGLPLLLHAFHKAVGQLAHESDAQHVALLARRYPELRLIMAHLAGAHLWGCAQIADCPNVWSDFSGSYTEAGTIETAIARLGEDRVLFGSDAPGIDYLNNLGKVEEAQLTAVQRRKILHDNAAALFG